MLLAVVLLAASAAACRPSSGADRGAASNTVGTEPPPTTTTYVNVGKYDVVVTERWTATWRLGGERGVLRTLQTTGRIDDFPVEQIQAVIRQ